MFKLKKFADDSQKLAAENEVITKLDELPLKINLIRKYKAGIDVRKLDWSFDIVLEMDFDSLADLDAYTIHPAHQEFVAFNKNYSTGKACIDYEI